MNLVTIYHVTFLILFILTAIVTLGGVLKWPGFRKIDSEFLTKLFYALLLEIVAGVILVFNNLPSPNQTTLEYFKVDVVYEDYLSNWVALQNEERQQCIATWKESGETTEFCKVVIEEHKAIQSTKDKTGKGEAYFVLNNDNNAISGNIQYTFPDDAYPTVLQVSGRKADNNKIEILVVQSERAIKKDGEISIRNARSYKLDLERPSEEHPYFEAGLFHPAYGKEGLKVASLRLTPS